MSLSKINANLNLTMSYGGSQKGILAPYTLPEHRYFIMEPENFGNKNISLEASWNNTNLSSYGLPYKMGYINYSAPAGQTFGLNLNLRDIKIISNKHYIANDLYGGFIPSSPPFLPLQQRMLANIAISTEGDTIHDGVYYYLDNKINKILINNNILYAVGDFTHAYNYKTDLPSNISSLDAGKSNISYFGSAPLAGGNWTQIGGGMNDSVKDIININNDIYVVGSFTKTGPTANIANRIAKWNITSTSWIEVSGGLDNTANCIVENGNDIYIGGLFITGSSSLGGNITLNHIAKWNTVSKTWSSLGNGLNGEVKTLYYDASENILYAGGSFTSASYNSTELDTYYVAYYKDNIWYSLNADKKLNGEVLSITKYDNTIYIGGNFSNTLNGTNQYSHLIQYKNGDFFNVGLGLNNNVTALASSNNLYIIGSFSNTVFGMQTITTKDIFTPFLAANYSNPRLAPRPQYIFNNHLPSSTGSSTYGGMKLFDLNDTNPLIPNATYKQYPEAIFVLNDGYIYETDKASGKKPFFDSYEEYIQDLKPLSQNYSIVPEFRMENVIEYFVKEKNGDFSSNLTSSYLSLDSNIDNLDDINTTINQSNPIKTFIEDASPNSKISNLTITVDALKKLLPYNGFYPQQRIAQLADQFINSFIDTADKYLSSDNIEYDTNLSNGTPRDQQILALLQPMFAPGILMNTIKSSIAVDWPTFIGNYGTYTSGNLDGIPSFYGNIWLSPISTPAPIGNYTSSYYLGNYLVKNFDFRFPFESLIEFDSIVPSIFKTGSNNLYYLDPTYYSTDVVSGSDRSRLRYPSYSITKDSGSLKGFVFKDNLYKLAMHNFLGEIPNFFLQNGLNNYVSAPIQNISAISGTAYVLDVVLERDPVKYKEFVQHPYYETLRNDINNFISGVYMPPAPDSLYGPPSNYFKDFSELDPTSKLEILKYGLSNYELKYLDSPAYAPYVPPYYYGRSVARIVFLPNETRNYTLDEVQQNALKNTQYFNYGTDDLFLTKGKYFGNVVGSGVFDTLAYKEKMQLSSSVNLFLKSEVKNTVVDASTGLAKEIADSTNPQYQWVIQSKFETPSINFANISDFSNTGMRFLGGYKTQFVDGIYTNLYKGLWTSYGEPVKNGEGIKMYLEYNPKNIPTGSISGSTDIKPLTDIIDFSVGQKEQKTIGLLANSKTVQEGVVIIPYYNSKTSGDYADTIDPIIGENGVYTFTYPSNIPRYFKIDRAKISELLKLPFESEALTFDQIKKQVNSNAVDSNNSIIKTIKAMTDFVIPPHLNWVKDRSIQPFVMYVFPFSTDLDTEDLSDIWQGVMPKPARESSRESIKINHKLDENNMFHGKRIPSATKFKIFKVKQQANINYYKLTADSKDDANFKFVFGNSEEAKIPEYSFNYPYDYFSLVELVNIKASLEVENPSKKDKNSA